MEDNEKDLLTTFEQLIPENRASLLAFAHVTHEAQENTRRAMERENRNGNPASEQSGKTA
jgi:hypothetical protein